MDDTAKDATPANTNQVTDRERQLESGGLWEAPTDLPVPADAGQAASTVTDRDRLLESGGFWEAPVDPAEDTPDR